MKLATLKQLQLIFFIQDNKCNVNLYINVRFQRSFVIHFCDGIENSHKTTTGT